MKIKFIFKWFDFWIGIFIDKQKNTIYILPVPMIGISITKAGNYCVYCKNPKKKSEMKSWDCCKTCDSTGGYIS